MRWYFARREQVVIAVLLLMILSALLVISYSYGYRRADRERMTFFDESTEKDAEKDPATVLVHVAGAVHTGGVYTLPAQSRVLDAIESAGGARDDACLDALNLAEPVSDGEKIYVPTLEEWERPAASASLPTVTRGSAGTPNTSAAPAKKTAAQPGQPISINSADKEELMTLPGIGEVMAQRILDYRAAQGPFRDIQELLNVPRMGVKTLERLEPFITL